MILGFPSTPPTPHPDSSYFCCHSKLLAVDYQQEAKEINQKRLEIITLVKLMLYETPQISCIPECEYLVMLTLKAL